MKLSSDPYALRPTHALFHSTDITNRKRVGTYGRTAGRVGRALAIAGRRLHLEAIQRVRPDGRVSPMARHNSAARDCVLPCFKRSSEANSSLGRTDGRSVCGQSLETSNSGRSSSDEAARSRSGRDGYGRRSAFCRRFGGKFGGNSHDISSAHASRRRAVVYEIEASPGTLGLEIRRSGTPCLTGVDSCIALHAPALRPTPYHAILLTFSGFQGRIEYGLNRRQTERNVLGRKEIEHASAMSTDC